MFAFPCAVNPAGRQTRRRCRSPGLNLEDSFAGRGRASAPRRPRDTRGDVVDPSVAARPRGRGGRSRRTPPPAAPASPSPSLSQIVLSWLASVPPGPSSAAARFATGARIWPAILAISSSRLGRLRQGLDPRGDRPPCPSTAPPLIVELLDLLGFTRRSSFDSATMSVAAQDQRRGPCENLVQAVLDPATLQRPAGERVPHRQRRDLLVPQRQFRHLFWLKASIFERSTTSRSARPSSRLRESRR